jgi:IS30 family transposase
MSAFLTYAERISLQKFLAEGLSFKEIGRTLGKDPTTISREVRKGMSEAATGKPGYPYNPCKHRKECRKKNYAVMNVIAYQPNTVSSAPTAQSIVLIFWRRSAITDFTRLMFATAAARSVSALF